MDFEIKTFKRLISAFEADKECKELQKEYSYILSSIKSIDLRNEIKKLEKLMNQKNLFDMLYAYRVGKSYAKVGRNINIYSQPLESIINTNRLYAIDEYYEICQEIKKQKNALYDTDNGYIKSIDLLFEVYSYYNYELIRFTFFSTYNER